MLSRAALLALGLATLAGCAARSDFPCDDRYFTEVRDRGAAGTEVTVCGTVRRVRAPLPSRSGRHLDFLLALPGGDDVWVDANLEVLGRLPLRRGDAATVRGEYYVDGPRRDGIHWTHRTTHGPHPPGYVIVGGVRYQ